MLNYESNKTRVNYRRKQFVKELLRQILFLIVILIGIVASSLPVAVLLQPSESPSSDIKGVSVSRPDMDQNSEPTDSQSSHTLVLVNDTGRDQRPKSKTAN